MKPFLMMLAGAAIATGLLRVVTSMAAMASESGLGGYRITSRTFAYCAQAPLKVVRAYRSLPGLETRWKELKHGIVLVTLGTLTLIGCTL